MGRLAGFLYRKSFTITHSPDGAQPDYQFVLKVYRSAGVDGQETIGNVAGGKVYVGSNCATDFDDIRITQSDGVTLCPQYKRYQSGTDYCIIWFKGGVPAHPDDFTGYVYYKGVETDVSSLVNVFGAAMADDFEWGNDEDNISNDGGNIDWTVTLAGTSTAKIDTAVAWAGTRSMRMTAQDAANACTVTCPKTAGTDYAVNFMLNKGNNINFAFGQGNGTHLLLIYAEPDEDITYYGASLLDSGQNVTAGAWQEFEINNINHATPLYDIYFNGSRIVDDAAMLDNVTQANVLYFLANLASDSAWVDSLIIRKFTANEPVWSSWGSEEYLPLPSAMRAPYPAAR